MTRTLRASGSLAPERYTASGRLLRSSDCPPQLPKMAEHPPTIIVVHPRERRQKCTVEPLRGRAGFVFWRFPETGPEPLEGHEQTLDLLARATHGREGLRRDLEAQVLPAEEPDEVVERQGAPVEDQGLQGRGF